MFEKYSFTHYDEVKIYSDLKQVSIEEAVENELIFTDKQSYLEWVANWKRQYLQISKTIREAKTQRKKSFTGQRTLVHDYCGQYCLNKEVVRDRALAYFMLMARTAGKIKSKRLKMENLNMVLDK